MAANPTFFEPDDWSWFPSRLRAAREAEGLSRSQLARRIDGPEKNVKNWEDGKSLPSLPYYGRLCDVFGWPRQRPQGDPPGNDGSMPE